MVATLLSGIPPEAIYAVITAIFAGIGSLIIRKGLAKAPASGEHPVDPSSRPPPFLLPQALEHVCKADNSKWNLIESELAEIHLEMVKIRRMLASND